MAEQIGFNPPVPGFLKLRGYSHIYNHGIIGDTDDYLLEPLTQNDLRLVFPELDVEIEDINNNDVFDMADGDEFITFYIQLTDDEFTRYKTSLT